jgi:hypothetical protein
MRSIIAILAFAGLMALIASGSAADEYLYVKDVTMHLKGDNVTFEMNYSLDTFTRFYVMALGAKYLEPELLSFFGNYSGVRLLKADMDGAALQVNGAGKLNNGYYLFDSRSLGSKSRPIRASVPKLTVVYPEGRIRNYYNVTSTQSVFCRASVADVAFNRSIKSQIRLK